MNIGRPAESLRNISWLKHFVVSRSFPSKFPPEASTKFTLKTHNLAMLRRGLENVATAGVIGAAGDTLMQLREGVTLASQLDTGRTARLVSFRMCHAPVVDAAWRFFDARIPFKGIPGVLARVFADQGFLMPPSITLFFVSQSVMEGCTLGESVRRAKDGFVPAALKCLPFWCTVHCVTFGVVAPRYRMAWASLCAVAWNAIISSENQEAIRRELALRELADSNFANGRENVDRRAMRKLE